MQFSSIFRFCSSTVSAYRASIYTNVSPFLYIWQLLNIAGRVLFVVVTFYLCLVYLHVIPTYLHIWYVHGGVCICELIERKRQLDQKLLVVTGWRILNSSLLHTHYLCLFCAKVCILYFVEREQLLFLVLMGKIV